MINNGEEQAREGRERKGWEQSKITIVKRRKEEEREINGRRGKEEREKME